MKWVLREHQRRGIAQRGDRESPDAEDVALKLLNERMKAEKSIVRGRKVLSPREVLPVAPQRASVGAMTSSFQARAKEHGTLP